MRRRPGLTLIELTVALGILGLVAGVSVTAAVGATRGATRVAPRLSRVDDARRLEAWLRRDLVNAERSRAQVGEGGESLELRVRVPTSGGVRRVRTAHVAWRLVADAEGGQALVRSSEDGETVIPGSLSSCRFSILDSSHARRRLVRVDLALSAPGVDDLEISTLFPL